MSQGCTMYQPGHRLLYSNAGAAIAAGDIVVLASGATGMIGIALVDIPATTGTGTVVIGGGDERVWSAPKATGEAFTQGQVVYFDGTQLTGTNTTTNTRAGRAAYAAASAATSCYFILNAA